LNPLSAVSIALAALGGNKLRSVLTMLGIVIGVSAVITLMAAGQGAQTGITERIRGLGSNLLFIRPAPVESGGGPEGVAESLTGRALTLVASDAYAIDDPERFPYIEAVAAQIDFEAQLIFGGSNIRPSIIGTTPSYQFARNFFVSNGRFLTEDDVIRKGLVIVLGSNVAEALFGDTDPIGKSVRLAAGPGGLVSFFFRVVGVMEHKGATATGDEDDLAFIPLPTMQARIPFLRNPTGEINVFQISVRISDGKYFDQATQEIGDFLAERHGDDDVVIRSQEDLISTVSEVSETLTILLGSIAGISLVVGGIGIMNIMLVSVTERTREIGIRKAVGARRSDILMQFMVEALVVTMVGGTLGVLLGVGAARIADGQMIGNQEVNTVVTPFSVIVAFAVSAIVGIFFGIYPAFRASRLNPIEALHHE
jgi:putative ABC transport system permease protein